MPFFNKGLNLANYLLHKGAKMFRITKFDIKNSVPLETVYSNITIDGLLSFKL